MCLESLKAEPDCTPLRRQRTAQSRDRVDEDQAFAAIDLQTAKRSVDRARAAGAVLGGDSRFSRNRLAPLVGVRGRHSATELDLQVARSLIDMPVTEALLISAG